MPIFIAIQALVTAIGGISILNLPHLNFAKSRIFSGQIRFLLSMQVQIEQYRMSKICVVRSIDQVLLATYIRYFAFNN